MFSTPLAVRLDIKTNSASVCFGRASESIYVCLFGGTRMVYFVIFVFAFAIATVREGRPDIAENCTKSGPSGCHFPASVKLSCSKGPSFQAGL